MSDAGTTWGGGAAPGATSGDLYANEQPGATDQARQVASTAADQGRQVAGTAAEQTKQVAGTAAEGAKQVAGEAMDQAAHVAQEAKEQAKSLLHEGRSQLREQANRQTSQASQGMRTFSQQLQALVEGRPEEAGPFGDYARQLATKVGDFADQLEQKGYEGSLTEVKTFARRRPGLFLAGAAAAGFAVGRAVRAAQAADSGPDVGGPGMQVEPYSSGAIEPMDPVLDLGAGYQVGGVPEPGTATGYTTPDYSTPTEPARSW